MPLTLSYIILTHNRREALLHTLRVLVDHTPLPEDQWEAIVIDNASTDGTAEAVMRAFPMVRVVGRFRNEGSPARNVGARMAQGDFLIFLDDDSYPCGDAVTRSIDFMQRHTRVGLVGGRVELPDGTEDAAALPIVMPACALCVRREAFASIGGFCDDFFRQAEEYDLIFRLLAAGWDVRRIETIVYRHEKVTTSRSPALIQRMDLRNNLVLAARFLPRDLRRQYRRDWLRRYAALAKHDGNHAELADTIADARRACVSEARTGRQALDAALIELIFHHDQQARLVRQWAQEYGIHRVVIADYTKNLYATWRACQLAELDVLAVCDNHPAYAAMRYRGIDVVTEASAAGMNADGVVLSNVNPARIDRRIDALSHRFAGRPVLRHWQVTPDTLAEMPQPEHQWRQDQYPRLAV